MDSGRAEEVIQEKREKSEERKGNNYMNKIEGKIKVERKDRGGGETKTVQKLTKET